MSSPVTSPLERMDHEAHDRRELEPQPRYADEDTRLTSKKELWGWYSYGFAAEVFVVCGIGKDGIPVACLSTFGSGICLQKEGPDACDHSRLLRWRRPSIRFRCPEHE